MEISLSRLRFHIFYQTRAYKGYYLYAIFLYSSFKLYVSLLELGFSTMFHKMHEL